MSRENEHPHQHPKGFRSSDVVDLYRRLGDGEPSETTWMGTDRKTTLWLLDSGESIPVMHPENVAVQQETAKMGEWIGPHSSGIPGWVLLTVTAVMATADLTLAYWFTHWFFGWF